MIVPAPICTSSNAATTRKYLPIRLLARRQGLKRRQHRIHRRIVGIVEEEFVDEKHQVRKRKK